jgi:hypothetical protein
MKISLQGVGRGFGAVIRRQQNGKWSWNCGGRFIAGFDTPVEAFANLIRDYGAKKNIKKLTNRLD